MISFMRSAARAGVPPPKYRLVTVFFSGSLASRQMDLPDQGVDVPAACLLGVEGLAVGTEAADAPAEGDMDVQPQAVTVRKGQLLIVFVF